MPYDKDAIANSISKRKYDESRMFENFDDKFGAAKSAYKDAISNAYKRYGKNPTEDQFKQEFSESYDDMQDYYRFSSFFGDDNEWEKSGINEFIDIYGTRDDFIKEGVKPIRKARIGRIIDSYIKMRKEITGNDLDPGENPKDYAGSVFDTIKRADESNDIQFDEIYAGIKEAISRKRSALVNEMRSRKGRK